MVCLTVALAHSNCKLASITLADENDGNQDLDDWDDVCLNVPRPPSLVQIYRDHMIGPSIDAHIPHSSSKSEVCDSEAQTILGMESIDLKEKITLKEQEMAALREEMNCKEKELFAQNKRLQKEIASLMSEELGGTRTRSVSSLSSVPKVDTGQSNSNGQAIESETLQENWQNPDPDEKRAQYLSSSYRQCLLGFIHPNLMDAGKATEGDSDENSILTLLANSLPNIVPNILLAKRGDVIPLLIATIVALQESASPDATRESRDKLLNTLFNLIKKPDEDQRRLILGGCLSYARLVGPVCVEVEFLPQCWEQIGHKHEERRILVAEVTTISRIIII
jgi:hypothetical protein